MSDSQRIFIVEDDTFLRELYVELLLQEGYEVDWAVDGEEAAAKIKEKSFDLTLLDIMLPKKDGLALLREAGEVERKNLGLVVMLTNLGQDAIIKEGFDLGAAGYLIKSALTPEQVLHEVRVFLSKTPNKT